MKFQDQFKTQAARMVMSIMVMTMIFMGCKKKNPADPNPAPTKTKTAVNTATRTPTLSGPTLTLTPSAVPSFTHTYTATFTATAADTSTETLTPTFTVTLTPSSTETETMVPTFTETSTSVCAPAPQLPVNLGTAGTFAILSKAGISTTGTTSIVGNLGVSPAAATYITGFGLSMDASNEFSTSSLVTGMIYAADYSPPTPANMTTAISDMEAAFTDAAGRTCPDATELGAGDISGMTLYPGLYKWGTGLGITTGVTLDCQGDANAVFIFQIAQDLTVANGALVTLSGSCDPKNIFWQVSGQALLGTTSDFKGTILCQTLIDMQTGAILLGRALAQTEVTLDANPVTESN